MICVRLEGGLGNQLFQYAAGRALALRHGCELLLDTSTLQRRNHRVTQRHLELQYLKHVGRVATERESRQLPWLHRAAYFSRWISPWQVYVEKGTAFNTAFDTLPDQTYLVGYWQSPRYFTHLNHILAQEFEPAEALSPASQAVEGRIACGVSVALHVRRGDYVSLASAAKFHGALPVSYYAAALQRLGQLLIDPQVFVFSDDPQWCRDHLPWGGPTTYVSHNAGQDAWQDLVLMARCKHHVIANSSFSWWAAWLADQRWGVSGRLVIAPNRWFARSARQHLQDRYLTHWQVLG